jgi:DNA-binding transcriptional MerR regulator
MTVRNVRAYQDRGLIPPPKKKGRAAYYSDGHLARLELIGELLDRGYNLQNIDELITAWEQGQDIGAVLGLEVAVAGPLLEEPSTRITVAELLEMFPGISPKVVPKVAQSGLLSIDGKHVVVRSMRLLNVGAELYRLGVPLDEILDTLKRAQEDVRHMARRFVRLIVRNMIDQYDGKLPQPSEAPELAELVTRLKPMASVASETLFAMALEEEIREEVGDRLHQFYEQIRESANNGDKE